MGFHNIAMPGSFPTSQAQHDASNQILVFPTVTDTSKISDLFSLEISVYKLFLFSLLGGCDQVVRVSLDKVVSDAVIDRHLILNATSSYNLQYSEALCK